MKLHFSTIIQVALLLISSNLIFAQNLEDYNWSDAKYLIMSSKYKSNDQVHVKRVQKYAYNFDEKKNGFNQLALTHYVIQINTEKGLKNRKELEPPAGSRGKEVLSFKVRIIHPDGSAYEFKKTDLQEKKESLREKIDEDDEDDEIEVVDDEEKDEKDEKTYTFYDLSNLRIGSQLEYFLVMKNSSPTISGSMINYQSRIPIQDFSYELNCDKEFSFLFKSYNGAPQVVRDSTNKVRTVYLLKDQMVDAFPKEKISNYGANVRGIIFKLEGYELGKKKNFFNYEDFSRSLYNSIYALNKKELKVLKKVVKQAKLKSLKTDEQKILALENYLKTTFTTYNVAGLNFLFSIENLYKYNSITGENAAKLMLNVLQQLKIDHEMVLSCNRFDYRFDKDFASNFFMDRFLIYFPSQNKFLDPYASGFRLGIIPSGFTHNHALFIRSVSAGGVTSGLGRIKFIDAPKAASSKDRVEVRVSFADDFKATNVQLNRTMTGYFAVDWQPFFRRTDPEQRVSFDNALFKFIDEKMEIIKTEYLNVERNDIQVKPFIINGKGLSKSLLIQKYDTLVFKIGNLIGEQTDLYKDSETRSLPIERNSSRIYERILTVELPENYSIQNIKDLNKQFELKNDAGNIAAFFKSSYELQPNNTLIVTIEEWYEDVILPSDKYQDFRKIMNASADFYKLELKMLK
jgi:hypothetical protein